MKLILATIGAAAVLNLAAFAGDLVPVQVPNGHGQIAVLYRSSEPTIAVFAGNGAVGSAASSKQLKVVSKDNGHGQTTTLYRAE